LLAGIAEAQADVAGGDQEQPSVYAGPPEFKKFEVAGHRFRVPTEYLTASSDQERGVFQIAPHWPTLDSPRTDKPQPRDRKDFDTLQVTVRSWSEKDYQRRFESRREELEHLLSRSRASQIKLEAVHGLVRAQGKSFLYTKEPLRIGKVEQPVRIICGSPNCWINYMPLAGVGVEIRFDKSILPRWRRLVRQVTDLIFEYRGE
jgi:hypothetical protein